MSNPSQTQTQTLVTTSTHNHGLSDNPRVPKDGDFIREPKRGHLVQYGSTQMKIQKTFDYVIHMNNGQVAHLVQITGGERWYVVSHDVYKNLWVIVVP